MDRITNVGGITAPFTKKQKTQGTSRVVEESKPEMNFSQKEKLPPEILGVDFFSRTLLNYLKGARNESI